MRQAAALMTSAPPTITGKRPGPGLPKPPRGIDSAMYSYAAPTATNVAAKRFWYRLFNKGYFDAGAAAVAPNRSHSGL